MRHHLNTIKNMQVNVQAFTSKRSTWEKYLSKNNDVSLILQEIFGNNKTVRISRADLFNLAQSGNYKRLIISTILWGYPQGMRGNHFATITAEINTLVNLLKEAVSGISDWTEHYSKANRIVGLGLSTYTKFLYFVSAKVGAFPCVILDKRIIDTINTGVLAELAPLIGVKPGTNAARQYGNYLSVIDDAANKYEVTHGQIEKFIFEFK